MDGGQKDEQMMDRWMDGVLIERYEWRMDRWICGSLMDGVWMYSWRDVGSIDG